METKDSAQAGNNMKLPLVEKYRPAVLDDLVLDSNVREYFSSIKSVEDLNHILLVSGPGTGKTSLAKILVNQLDAPYRYINASDERGIDTIRDKVKGFAQTKSILGGMKIVILDECLDGDTLVYTLRDGIECQIPIQELDQENDLVRSYNRDTDRVEYRSFIHSYMGERECFEVELDNGEVVICTGSHKWYVEDKTGAVVKMKLDDIIANGITEILTKVDSTSN